jgi:hypothetical protein
MDVKHSPSPREISQFLSCERSPVSYREVVSAEVKCAESKEEDTIPTVYTR